MVKPWLSTGVRRGSRPSTRCRLQEERSDVSSLVRNSDGAWPGPRTAAILSSEGLVGWRSQVGFGRSPGMGASPNGCNSVRRAPNLRFAGIDWCTRARLQISISGSENSTHCLHWFPPRGFCLPRQSKAVSSRPTGAGLSSSPPAVVLMKCGSAEAMEATSFN